MTYGDPRAGGTSGDPFGIPNNVSGDPYFNDPVDEGPPIPDWQALEVIGANGRTTSISYGYAVQQGWVPGGLTVSRYTAGGWAARIRRTFYDLSLNPPRSGGGRGGSAGPTYQAPDTASIRETMKAYVVATTGKANEALIEASTNEFLKQDKGRFQASVSGAADIDPMLRAMGVVRESSEYKTIHQQRPDSVDEMEWVVERQTVLRNLGLNANSAEDLGITAAQGAATTEGLVGAAQIRQVSDTGRLLQSHRDNLISKASAAMRLM